MDFLAALRGLTIRGHCFVATGLACCALAVTVGEKDLLRVGLLLLALPVCSTAFVCRTRYRLACHRRLAPVRSTVGAAVSVSIRIDNMGRRSSSVLLVDDDVPAHLGFRARFVLDRVEPGGARYLTYQLRPQLRGRYLIGPMAIRITDPFGLCELTRTFRSRDELVVTPPLEALLALRPGRQIMIGNLRERTRPTLGTDDFVTRPYQAGDDLRRIHWRTSARAGELMVRREESFRPASATVLLDTRSDAWVGHGPTSSFEWAVSATGSIAAHLAESGQLVSLICDGGVTATPAAGRSRNPTRSTTALLDALAVVTTSDASSFPGASLPGAPGNGAAAIARTDGNGMLVAVLGSIEPARAGILAMARPHGAFATALLVDVATWDGNRSTAREESLNACRALFQRHGWVVITAGYGDKLADLWLQTSGRGTAGGGGDSRVGYRADSTAAGMIHHDLPNQSNSLDSLDSSDRPPAQPGAAGSEAVGPDALKPRSAAFPPGNTQTPTRARSSTVRERTGEPTVEGQTEAEAGLRR
ncbi:DUF58 domain-containing protein [Protofrankia symbiont of Coriaria ruscifolia]|uniref:DUF58 domain-containing protein n=1 Tax=Protofrankia symbiont of Coriaria ruscifolia TaxID=1306542 RepID=UPI001A940F11|nr:DUF58 domain-containing protein [Protofrankia symbiont of Coriaria ruscifolia]